MSQKDNTAMEIDPVDDGPKELGSMLGHFDSRSPNHRPASLSITQEEDARQAIEMLRGDDVSERVSAANRLDSVAAALGEIRTREVRTIRISNCHSPFVLLPACLRSCSFHIGSCRVQFDMKRSFYRFLLMA